MSPKEFYANYLADDNVSELNHALAAEVMAFNPAHVFEFGAGTGKNLKLIEKIQTNYARHNVVTIGMDLSVMNVLHARIKNGLNYFMHGDEGLLRNIVNCDVVITCSVLDHIEDVEGIIWELKRIANKAVIIAETNDTPAPFYYPHNYERYGFVKKDFTWHSPKPDGDGAIYNIWVLDKYRGIIEHEDFIIDPNDDLGTAKPRK